MQPDFDLLVVEQALAGTCFSGTLHHLAATTSTNALALAAAQSGARNGVWVADEQTAGRGRGGHTWHSPPGDGLYISALVAPAISSRVALHLSFATGLAAQTAIAQATGLKADIRWPNDLLLAGRKCGGILVEATTEPATGHVPASPLRYAVIGVGINVGHAQFPAELASTATSLRLEAGHDIRRENVLLELLRALDRELDMLTNEAEADLTNHAPAFKIRPPLLERFAARSSWVQGKRVVVDDRYTGTTAGLSEEGFLQVDGDDGVVHTVRSGGVRDAAADPLLHSNHF